MSSLVERLRATEVVGWQPSADGLGVAVKTPVNPDGPEAANKIERLREALAGLIGAVEMDANGEHGISGYTSARLTDAREALSLHKGGRDGD